MGWLNLKAARAGEGGISDPGTTLAPKGSLSTWLKPGCNIIGALSLQTPDNLFWGCRGTWNHRKAEPSPRKPLLGTPSRMAAWRLVLPLCPHGSLVSPCPVSLQHPLRAVSPLTDGLCVLCECGHPPTPRILKAPQRTGPAQQPQGLALQGCSWTKALSGQNQVSQIKLLLYLFPGLISQARIILGFLSRTRLSNWNSTNRLKFMIATKNSFCGVMKQMKNYQN